MQAHHRPGTTVSIEARLRLHVYPVLGEQPLNGIFPSDVQAWVKGRSQHLQPATLRLAFAY